MTLRRALPLLVLPFLLASCGKPPLPPLALPEGCQPLLGGSDCTGPFPSNYFLSEDASLPSGHRLLLTDAARVRTTVGRVDPNAWRPVDGASLTATLVTSYPGGLSPDGFTPVLADPVDSVADGAHSLWVEASTGHRVRHFVDLDARAKTPETRALVLHTREGLNERARYVVAIRGALAPDGSLAPAPEGFRRIRDGEAKGDPQLEPLAVRFEKDVFPALAAAGWNRKDVQLAWDFTTGTRANASRDMLRVRELTLAWLASNTPKVKVKSLDVEAAPHLWRTLLGTVEGPLFTEQDAPESPLHRGADGQVAQNGTVAFPFRVEVPLSVRDATGPVQPLMFGHGFFGDTSELHEGTTPATFDRLKVVAFGTPWVGMSFPDSGAVAGAMLDHPGEALRFTDRVHQAMANWLVFTRAIEGPMRSLEELNRPASGAGSTPPGTPLYTEHANAFMGISMGHILGGTLAGLHPSLDRVVLEMGGASFCTMMMRARPFAAFLLLLDNSVREPLEQQKLVALLQAPFDRVDPATYAPWVLGEKLPGTVDGRRLLMQFGLGDTTVPNIGPLLHAQLLGLPMLTPSPAPASYHGLAERPSPFDGSAVATYDFGINLQDAYAVPNPDKPDSPVHGAVRHLEPAMAQVEHFLETGVVQNYCDGTCNPD